jgi:hypothetical protein
LRLVLVFGNLAGGRVLSRAPSLQRVKYSPSRLSSAACMTAKLDQMERCAKSAKGRALMLRQSAAS